MLAELSRVVGATSGSHVQEMLNRRGGCTDAVALACHAAAAMAALQRDVVKLQVSVGQGELRLVCVCVCVCGSRCAALLRNCACVLVGGVVCLRCCLFFAYGWCS